MSLIRLQSALLRLPSTAVFSGRTAAWLHGLDVELGDRIEVTLPKETGVTTRSGMIIRRAALDSDEVIKRRGFSTTSIARTLLDISHRLELTEAVVVADMAVHAKLIKPDQLNVSLLRYRRLWGIKELREVARHSEPKTESPMETRLRMLLVLAGLPRPQAQVPIHDRFGRFLGRPDLYYPQSRLGLEYDGGTHRSTLADDDRRQNRLVDAGVRLLRFTAGDIYNAPNSVVALVSAGLKTVHTNEFPSGSGFESVHTNGS